MKPLVSILIPAYNSEKWIRECIESALAQTWRRKEIIIVDDGSRDSTLAIAQSFASRSVHVTTQENSGASAARNHALSLAQGDYIQWLDADDLLAHDKIAEQFAGRAIGRDDRTIFSCSWGKFYYRPERTKFKPDSLWQSLDPLEWLYRKIDENLWMPPMVFLVSRVLTEIAGGWDERLTLDDDGEYFCRLISSSSKVEFSDRARCFKRNTFGISSTFCLNNRKLDSLASSISVHVQTLLSMEDSSRTRNACMRFLQRWASYFYPERPDLLERMQNIAKDIGGRIETPKLRKKYRLVQRVFGWRFAKKCQNSVPQIRSFLSGLLDRMF